MTKIRQSKELVAFYNAYNKWLEAGAPEENDNAFDRKFGLCGQIRLFLEHKLVLDQVKVYEVMTEMEKQFHKAGLAIGYPFGMNNYDARVKEESQHLDPMRIAWVKSHLTEEVDSDFVYVKDFSQKIEQSDEMVKFYNAYNDWLKLGLPEKNKHGFRKSDDLYDSLHRYIGKVAYDTDIHKEMINQFQKANLHPYSPFRYRNTEKALDVNQVAWVKEHLNKTADRDFIVMI